MISGVFPAHIIPAHITTGHQVRVLLAVIAGDGDALIDRVAALRAIHKSHHTTSIVATVLTGVKLAQHRRGGSLCANPTKLHAYRPYILANAQGILPSFAVQ